MAITNPNLMNGFDTNGTNVSEPSSSQQSDGYTINEVPLSANHAYMFKQWYSNFQYLKKNGLYQWDASLSYNSGSFIMYDEVLYQSQADTNSNNLPNAGDRTKWIPLTSDINSYVAKATPVDADEFVGADSAASFALKKFTFANIKATLKTYFDTLYGNFVANDSRVKTALNASGTAPIYACRAWVNFNGTGTVAIRASGNISSITDNGTGDYTVNFITAMEDVNYSISQMGQGGNGVISTTDLRVRGTIGTAPLTTSSVRLHSQGSNEVLLDSSQCFVQIFR